MESSPRVNLSHEDNSHDRTRLRSRSLALLLPSDSSRHFARIPNLCPCHDTLQQSVSYTVLVSAYISKIFSVKFSLLNPGPSSLSLRRSWAASIPTPVIDFIIFHMSKVVYASQGLAPLPTATPLKTLIPSYESYSDPTSRLVATSTTLGAILRSRTGSIFIF